MNAANRTLLIVIGAALLVGLACSAPVLVPTAEPLPSLTPTWTLLPAATQTPLATDTPLPPTDSPGNPTATAGPGTEPPFECPGAPPTRLAIGDSARVTFTDGIPLRVREDPEVKPDNVKAQIAEGTQFTITGGPECAPIPGTEEAFVFWNIQVAATGLTGWAAEGDLTAYYIEPLP